MADLLFLKDLSQFKSIMKKMPNLLVSNKIITNNSVVATELERLNHPFIHESKYLELNDMTQSLTTANQLAEHWCDEAQAEINFCGISLTQAARQDLVLPFELCLNARIAYQKLLNSESARHIYSYFIPPTAMCRTGPTPAPAFRSPAAITQAVLLWLAHTYQISVTSLRSFRPSTEEGRQFRPRISDNELKYCLLNKKILIEENLKSRNSSTREIVLLNMGLWPQEIEGLEKGFSKYLNWRVLKLSSRELSLGRLTSQSSEYNSIVKKLDHIWQIYYSSINKYSGNYPEIFGNPFLKFQFARIFDEIKTAIRLGQSFSNFLDAFRPSLVVLGHDAFTIERTLVNIARSKGIPTVGLIHGGLGPLYGLLGIVGDVDHVFVWGKEDVRRLNLCGFNHRNIHPVGSLRFDRQYQSIKYSYGNGPDILDKYKIRQNIKLPTNKHVVLLLTSPTNIGLAQFAADPEKHRKTWLDLVALAKRRADLIFAIKPHPAYDFIDFYRHLCRIGPNNLVMLKPVNLELALQASDLAVLINYCSTASIEAILWQVPLIFLRTAIYPTPFHEDPLDEQGAINVFSIEEFESTINSLLNDTNLRQKANNNAKLILDSLFCNHDSPALNCLMSESEKISLAPEIMHLYKAASFEECLSQRLNAILRLILGKKETDQILLEITNLVGMLKAKSEKANAYLEQIMFGLAFALGNTTKNAKELGHLSRTYFSYFRTEWHVPKKVIRIMLMKAYLAAIIRSYDSKQFDKARSYAWQALIRIPNDVVFSRLFWQFLLKSLIGYNRFALFLVNVIARSKMTFLRITPPRYIKIK